MTDLLGNVEELRAPCFLIVSLAASGREHRNLGLARLLRTVVFFRWCYAACTRRTAQNGGGIVDGDQ